MSDNVKTIRIGFSKPDKSVKFPIAAKLIQLFMGTEYSHTYVKFYSETFDTDLIYEATLIGGVRFIGTKLWEEHNDIVREYSLDISAEQHTNLMKFFIDNAGQKYAWQQLVLIGINYILKLLKLQPIMPKVDSETMICSEVIVRLLHDVYGLTPTKPLDLYEPKDIEQILTTYNR